MHPRHARCFLHTPCPFRSTGNLSETLLMKSLHMDNGVLFVWNLQLLFSLVTTMAATQTQHSTGWNSKADGTQDAERNAWSVEYASLVVKRPAPVPTDHAGSTGRLNFKLFRSKNTIPDASVRSQIQSVLDQQSLEKDMQDGAELLRYLPICSLSLFTFCSHVLSYRSLRCMQPAPARGSS